MRPNHKTFLLTHFQSCSQSVSVVLVHSLCENMQKYRGSRGTPAWPPAVSLKNGSIE